MFYLMMILQVSKQVVIYVTTIQKFYRLNLKNFLKILSKKMFHIGDFNSNFKKLPHIFSAFFKRYQQWISDLSIETLISLFKVDNLGDERSSKLVPAWLSWHACKSSNFWHKLDSGIFDNIFLQNNSIFWQSLKETSRIPEVSAWNESKHLVKATSTSRLMLLRAFISNISVSHLFDSLLKSVIMRRDWN